MARKFCFNQPVPKRGLCFEQSLAPRTICFKQDDSPRAFCFSQGAIVPTANGIEYGIEHGIN